MDSSLNRICGNYVPVLSEAQGIVSITYGVAALGIAGLYKIEGLKAVFIFDDASFWAEIGKGAIKQGVKQLLPITAGVVLTICLLSAKVLT